MFTATTDVSYADIEREAGVLCSRDNRGSGSDCRKNRENAIRSMDPKFGVTRHFVSSLAGEAEEGDATKIGIHRSNLVLAILSKIAPAATIIS